MSVFCVNFATKYQSFQIGLQLPECNAGERADDPRGMLLTHRFLFSCQTEMNYAGHIWSINTTLGLQTGRNVVYIVCKNGIN